MRVLLTTDVVGGVWDHTLALCAGLQAAGDDCLVAMIGEPTPDRIAALPAGVEHASTPLRLEWMQGAAGDVRAAVPWLQALVRDRAPDLVHFNQFAYAAAGFDAPVLVAAHSDVRSWWSEVMGRAAPAEWDEYGAMVRAGLRAADRVVAPSVYQSALLARHYGRAAEHVIANGIPPAADRGDARPASRRAGVATVGRAWDPAKGVGTLDRAAGTLGGAAGPVRLAGPLEGPDGAGFRPRHLEPLGFIGRAAMDGLLAETAIYVGTSLYEPFGLAPLEAAHHGCALVLSDIGSFRDLWGDAAAFFPPGDAARLAELLGSLRADPERLDALAAAAQARARERYTADAMTQAYRALYADMLSRAPAMEAS